MRRILPLIFALTLLLTPSMALAAQESPPADSLKIAIWPEYDRPATLVMYLLRLDPGASLPARVRLPIPASVGEPHAVAAWHPDGSLDDRVSWERVVEGEWAWIAVEVETTGVWLEYYAPLHVEGQVRSMTVRWPGGLDIDDLQFEIMHTLGSEGFQVSPSGETALGEDGLTYTRMELGGRSADEAAQLSFSYTKPGPWMAEPLSPPAAGQPLAWLEVAIWPEYDQPAALVIYRAQLPPETALPAQVSLPIPAEAGEPHAVATVGSDRNLYLTEYERILSGQWAWITLTTDSPLFQVELYLPLVGEGRERSFSFLWPGGVDLDEFGYEIQHPPGAQGLRVTPAGAVRVGEDGLSYSWAGLGPKAAGDLVTVAFDYARDDDTLTVDAVIAPPSLQRPESTQGGTPDLAALMPYLFGGLGVLLIGAGVAVYLRMRAEPAPARRRRPRRRAQRPASDEIAPAYCHVCGTQASASDRFCRRCGAQLRH